MPLALAGGASVAVAWPVVGQTPWASIIGVAAGAAAGAAVGVLAARSPRARRLHQRLLPAAYGPALVALAVPVLATIAGAAYALLGGEGGGAGRIAGLGLLLLLAGASLAAVPLLWGVEYGVADWVRRRNERPQPVRGLDLVRVELLGRPFPRRGRRGHDLYVMQDDGGRLTVSLLGEVCLNDRNYERQDPTRWLCPVRATLEVSGRLDAEAGSLVVDFADGAWIRSLPAPRDPSLSKRGVAVGLRIAAGALVALGAGALVEPRIEPRYAPACRQLFRDPGTLRAPLVQPERCQQLLAETDGGLAMVRRSDRREP